jgi:hypothetical protein
MKNMQVIEPAENCGFSVYAVEESDFHQIFPNPVQDVEFVEDIAQRLGESSAGALIIRATSVRRTKTEIQGIHGTLFFGYEKRKKWFPTKRDVDLDQPISF